MLHGWMDVSASFQFVVDALEANWRVIAPDWRGFGLSQWPDADCYWFADYLGDLDALIERYSPDAPARIVAHSMGGNVAMLYAGVRPARVARLLDLDGIGLPPQTPDHAPARYAQWLDEIRVGQRIADYPDLEAVAQRLMKNNPRLPVDRARFIAGHWSRQRDDGRFEVLGDPDHKIVNPYLYRVDEVTACWRAIAAPMMMVRAGEPSGWHRFLDSEEYARRLAAIPDCTVRVLEGVGHMMHHDSPARIAALIEEFMT